MFSFRKYPYSPHRRDWSFLGRGVGGSERAKKSKKMYEAQSEFSKGLGEVIKFPSWERYEYFLELHNA